MVNERSVNSHFEILTELFFGIHHRRFGFGQTKRK